MEIYIAVILLILLLHRFYMGSFFDCNLEYGINSDKEIKYIKLVGLIFVLLLTLRGMAVGLDTYQYYNLMTTKMVGSLQTIIQNERHEPLFLALTYLVHFTDNFLLLKLSVSLIFIGGTLSMINKYSKMTALSCLLFFLFGFFYLGLNEMRQAVATGITCISFQYLVDKNSIKYIIGIILAGLFHYSAFIMLPMVILVWIDRINFKYFSLVLVGLFLMFQYSNRLFATLTAFTAGEYSLDESTGGWGLLLLQITILLIGYLKRESFANSRSSICAFYFIGFSVALFPLCHTMPTFFRLEKYAWILMIVFVPNILSTFKSKQIRNISILLFLALGCYRAFTQSFTEFNQTLPYIFYWNE